MAPNCEERRAPGRNWCEFHVEENEQKEDLPFWRYDARGHTEHDVTLELVDRLREVGFLVRLEFYIPGSGIRADVAVWADPTEKPFLVEVKASAKHFLRHDRQGVGRGRQDEKYAALGWPYYFCFGMEGIESTLDAVDRWASPDTLSTWMTSSSSSERSQESWLRSA